MSIFSIQPLFAAPEDKIQNDAPAGQPEAEVVGGYNSVNPLENESSTETINESKTTPLPVEGETAPLPLEGEPAPIPMEGETVPSEGIVEQPTAVETPGATEAVPEITQELAPAIDPEVALAYADAALDVQCDHFATEAQVNNELDAAAASLHSSDGTTPDANTVGSQEGTAETSSSIGQPEAATALVKVISGTVSEASALLQNSGTGSLENAGAAKPLDAALFSDMIKGGLDTFKDVEGKGIAPEMIAQVSDRFDAVMSQYFDKLEAQGGFENGPFFGGTMPEGMPMLASSFDMGVAMQAFQAAAFGGENFNSEQMATHFTEMAGKMSEMMTERMEAFQNATGEFQPGQMPEGMNFNPAEMGQFMNPEAMAAFAPMMALFPTRIPPKILAPAPINT
jgi:hypothetical protein